ncbi:CDP-alcohol phosphatidyltransferase family protein [Paenibacillus sacheonensis]|uniref:CDP-diacylglycerol--glycerol-3-phosphate 3-phosphatidyltransferase n=1 Tax=Paenibacillus sacheonensis TaxID=742054 RepID=A0A7X5C093_9BACL|nr:CDP-alcohol phosphatidyltransferase family protein [Paenibacillus sacheonensis]MBM7566502.1 cardiolipin synthase [Paenibacillus sacheonensis]NBC73488.1 CDP-diacylglycerol--glycerol-3-phosphate 3-phosphatidyltransferase [Paenibacillus sacheonensis]
MNVPNMLTMVRFALIPVYIAVFASDSTNHMKWAFLIIVVAGLTDILDGYLARKYGQVTSVGSMLDPLADKTMMITVILSLLLTGHIPWSAGAAIFIRDAGMILGSAYFHFRGKKTVPANWMGKLTTMLYYLAIFFIFFEMPWARAYLWCVIGFSFVTSFIYIGLFMALNRQGRKTKASGDTEGASGSENHTHQA